MTDDDNMKSRPADELRLRRMEFSDGEMNVTRF